MTQKKGRKHIKNEKKQRYNLKSNNFFSIIDTDKIKTYLETLGLQDSENIFSIIT